MIQEYKVTAIKQSDLSNYGEFTDRVYRLLYDVASYKVDDGGFSFFIRKTYLDNLLKDIKADKKSFPDIGISDAEIAILEKLYDLCENDLLLIDNDDLITKQSRRTHILENKLDIK
jgi:hypothetical protein